MAETIIHKTKTKKDTQGNLITETSETRIKNREKKDKFMLLYVENFMHLTKLNRKTLEVLALIISRRVTYGNNEVIIDSKFRVEIANELGMNKQNISRSIKELNDNNIINRKQISDRIYSYYLNPYIFGNGDFNAVEKQRIQYCYDFDFSGFSVKKSMEVSTEYTNSSKNDNVKMEISNQTINEKELKDEIEKLKNELQELKNMFKKD